MKLFKHSETSKFFQVHELTDDQLIAMYNICINYKSYLEQIIKLPDAHLLKVASGIDATIVRNNLKMQFDFCEEYIKFWDTAIVEGSPNKN